MSTLTVITMVKWHNTSSAECRKNASTTKAHSAERYQTVPVTECSSVRDTAKWAEGKEIQIKILYYKHLLSVNAQKGELIDLKDVLSRIVRMITEKQVDEVWKHIQQLNSPRKRPRKKLSVTIFVFTIFYYDLGMSQQQIQAEPRRGHLVYHLRTTSLTPLMLNIFRKKLTAFRLAQFASRLTTF